MYKLNPVEIFEAWTLPQVMYTWATGMDMVNLDYKRQLVILSGAITATLSKNGKQVLKRLHTLFDGPSISVEQMYEELSDVQRLVLFGAGSQQEPDGS